MSSMNPLEFFTDEDLLNELQNRQEAKELAYLFYLGFEGGDEWLFMSHVEYDQLQDIYELEMDEFEENHLYDSDNWEPDSDNEDQFNEDFSG